MIPALQKRMKIGTLLAACRQAKLEAVHTSRETTIHFLLKINLTQERKAAS